uniref:Glycosyltransferase n=1 Tax=Anthurium amnicola TaxID=1678845 RepID=A0A1D1YSL6_9ARAE
MVQQQPQHFLLVTFPAQGHINPALQLAKRLTRTGALVTFATAISAHRRMFSSSSPAIDNRDDEHQQAPLLSFSPYSDGYDGGFNPDKDDTAHYMSQIKIVGFETLTGVALSLADQGRPVTCIVYTLLLPWVADVARELGVPSVLFWIQPATVFSAYYHYFHGFADLISSHNKEPWFTVELPGMPPLRIRDLPSFLLSSDTSEYYFALLCFEEMYQTLDREVEENKKGSLQRKIKVLMNTFDELEHEQLAAVDTMELIPIGPLLPSAYTDEKDKMDTAFGGDLLEPDVREGYMEWLDAKPEGSVVYVSFGSMSVLPARQREEISRALFESGRPYLWVVRGNREGVEEGAEGKLVEWCSQLEVLSHRAVGCFVTHCGWNSTVESLACGVPTVGFPQWTDQPTNAQLAEASWGVGVRAEVDVNGLADSAELRRCLDLVMGEGERGTAIRRKAATWREQALNAVTEGGSSDRNLKAFVEDVQKRIRL